MTSDYDPMRGQTEFEARTFEEAWIFITTTPVGGARALNGLGIWRVDGDTYQEAMSGERMTAERATELVYINR